MICFTISVKNLCKKSYEKLVYKLSRKYALTFKPLQSTTKDQLPIARSQCMVKVKIRKNE